MEKGNKILKKTLPPLLFILVVLLSFAFQQTEVFEIGEAQPLLVLPALLCFATVGGYPFTACLLAVPIGLVWDFYALRPVGYYSVLLLGCCLVATLFAGKKPISVTRFVVMSTAFVGLVCVLDIILFYYIFGYENVWALLPRHSIPIILFTSLLSPVYFKLAGVIASPTKD